MAPASRGALRLRHQPEPKESGFRSRGNITWHITPDTMAYYTYSQGFRPGGFNRTHVKPDGTVVLKGEAPFTAGDKSTDQFLKPAGYDSDNLVNNEIGVKTEFWDHRVQINASAYRMVWSNVQLPLFDPVHLGNTTFDINGPSYTVKGFELQAVARLTEGLTVQGSGSWNSTNQTNAPCLTSDGTAAGKNNPTPAGMCISQVNSLPYTNPYGVLDTSPAFSPSVMFNVRARYDWVMPGDYKPWYGWVQATSAACATNRRASRTGIHRAPTLRPRLSSCTRCRRTRPMMRRSGSPRTTGRCS